MLGRLRRDARVLAERFSLSLQALDSEGPRVKRRYGICYDDGSIRIRLRHASSDRLLKYSALVDTLCHELAHLRHLNHGVRFQTLYRKILEYARRTGIYRPRPRFPSPRAALPQAPLLAASLAPPPAPERPVRRAIQLELFPAEPP